MEARRSRSALETRIVRASSARPDATTCHADEHRQSSKNEVYERLAQQHGPAAHLFGIVGQIVFLSRQPPGMYQIGDV
jgi:hypothetical protein